MRSLFFIFLPLATLSSLAPVSNATAQIIPDNSLGAESSVVNPNVVDGIDLINGGAIRGSNLFHSFQEFNIDADRGAYFSNPADIANILTRVTGGNPSNILGTLGVLGNANLFLINPKGIYFGSNARLNLGGSFFATTADSLVFDNNFEFSATNPQAPPLLTVNIPIGLRFRDIPGSIINNANSFGLGVQPGKSLALVGGDVNFNSGLVVAPGGRVELGGLAQAGTVGLNPDNSLSFPDGVTRGNVSINDGGVSVRGIEGDSGDINIQANSFSLTDNAGLSASHVGQGNAGNITVKAQDTVSLANNSLMLSNVGDTQETPSEGNVGNILIEAREVSLSNGSQLQAGFYSNTRGKPGTIFIRAKDSVSFQRSGIFADVYPKAVGNGSDIEILAGSVFLTNGARLKTSNEGQGNAGNITVQAQDTVSVTGNSLILSNIGNPWRAKAEGNVGNILIEAREVSLTNGSQLQAGFYSNTRGKPGTIFIRAKDSVSFQRSGIFADVYPKAVGNGSDIEILAGSVFLTNGARLKTSNEGQGNAGNITVQAQDTVSLVGNSLILSNIGNREGAKAEGNVGNIQIEAREVSLTDGAELQAGFYSNTKGNPGIVSIRAKDSVSFQGGGIFTNVDPGSEGDGSDIEISARLVSVSDRAVLKASNSGQGNGGNINITARSIKLDNQGKIEATANSGNGGNISLNVKDYLLMEGNSTISTSAGTAQAGGNGGNIFINSLPNYRGFVVAIPSQNSDITANAFTGQGGKVIINSDGIFGFVPRSRQDLEKLRPNDLDPKQIPTNDITAISQQNPTLSGTVTINTPDIDPSKGLTELPENVTDPSDRIAENPCQKGVGSEFIITGRGGLPTHPNQNLNNDNVRVDLVKPAASRSNSQSAIINQPITYTTSKQIIPAQGWVLNNKGEVVLVAYDPTATNLTQRASSRKNAVCPAPF